MAEGADQPVGNVVVFAIPEVLPVAVPSFIALYVPVPSETFVPRDEALKGPFWVEVLAV